MTELPLPGDYTVEYGHRSGVPLRLTIRGADKAWLDVRPRDRFVFRSGEFDSLPVPVYRIRTDGRADALPGLMVSVDLEPLVLMCSDGAEFVVDLGAGVVGPVVGRAWSRGRGLPAGQGAGPGWALRRAWASTPADVPARQAGPAEHAGPCGACRSSGRGPTRAIRCAGEDTGPSWGPWSGDD